LKITRYFTLPPGYCAPMSAPYRTVLFDLDGTLLDTIDMIVESLRHATVTHLDGFDPGHTALVAGVGTPLVEQLERHAHSALGPGPLPTGRVQQLVDAYLAHNHAVHDAHVRAYAGVPTLLDALAEAGVAQAIVTSKAHWIARHGLELCGLSHHFEILVASEDVIRHKPDPEPVLTALAALGRPVEGTLFVGDSPHDMGSGRNARVDTAAALWGPFPRPALEPSGPTHWLSRPEELLALI
jgi:pyrophosphatase PpaX